MTQHDAIYLVGFFIMMNDGPSLLSLIFDNWAKNVCENHFILMIMKVKS